jgi:hypothetical protein
MGFWISGYEPLQVLRQGSVVQVVMAKRDAGLYGLTPPVSLDAAARLSGRSYYLFVNEANQPLVRCTSSWQCDTPTSGFDDNLVQH